MEQYNYMDQVEFDCKWVAEHDYIPNYDFNDFNDFDDFLEQLRDDLVNSDSVTGNASGSYTFCTWTAEENLCHNWEILEDACNEFDYDACEVLRKGPENADVLIRCYCVYEVWSEVTSYFEDLYNEKMEELEND